MNLNNLFEGAIDDLERRRIEDLEAKMDDLAIRAKESTDPRVVTALRHEFAKAKAERDSYYYVNEAPGAETLSHNEKIAQGNLDAFDLEEHGGGGGGPRQWHAYVRAHRTDEGWQDFNKVEPYEVCLAGKPVKTFDYYEDARRFHDNWKKKLYNQGEKEKADKITLNPIMKEEYQPVTKPVKQPRKLNPGWALDPTTRAELKRQKDRQKTIAKWAGKDVPKQGVDEGSMAAAAHHPSGAKFGGYWKGTDKNPPKPGQGFGGCEESKEPQVPQRNFVAKNMKQSGQGKHKDDKRAMKQGNVKHKAQRIPTDEGAKVDRMAKHIEKSEKAAGKSKKDAESIAWATLNKRGYLDNANKKKHTNEEVDNSHETNFISWVLNQGNRFQGFTANPETYAQAKEAYRREHGAEPTFNEGMSNALSNITRRIAQPVSAKTIIKNREQKKDSIKRQHFAESGVDEDVGSLVSGATELWNVIGLIKEYGLPLGLFAAAVGMYGLAKAAEYLEQGDDKFAQMAKPAVKKVPPETIHKITNKLNQAFATVTSKSHILNPMASAMDFTEENISEIKKGQKDSNGNTGCWTGYHAQGTKKGKNGGQVRNCVPNESVDEALSKKDLISRLVKDLPRIDDPKNKEAEPVKWTGPGKDDYGYTGYQGHGMPTDRAERARIRADKKKGVAEDWQKANKKDKTDGMSQKAVNAYKREHPGSKLKTAVTTPPSKLKKGSKDSKRRKSYCARSAGQKKMHNIDCSKTPDKAICKARKRWNCESQEQFDAMLREAVEKSELQPGQYYVWTVYFDDGTNKRVKVTKDTFDPKAYYAKQNKVVVNVDYDWTPKNG